MRKKVTDITPQMEYELSVFMSLWGGRGRYTIVAPDETMSVIQPVWDIRKEQEVEREKQKFLKVAKRGTVSIMNRVYDTGEYCFIPLFVNDKDSVKKILELIKPLASNNQNTPEYNYIGAWIIKYPSNYCVMVKSEIPNVSYAQKMIDAFVKWIKDNIDADVATSDKIPLANGQIIPIEKKIETNYHYHGGYCLGINAGQISVKTGLWYDSDEKPLPPMWLSEINMTKNPDASDIFTSIGNTPIVQRGGITLISGAAKSGKTLLLSSIIASTVGRDTILGIAPGTPARILWCDTEQSENDLAVVRQRIEGLAGTLLKNADIKGLRLRPFGPEKSTEIIENALKQYEPDILLIDGPGDLCTDTNDIAASQATVKTLLRWCDEYDCAVVGVVHTNPGSEKTRGHIGSEIERKCAFSLLTAKNDALDSEYPTFKVKPGFMRGRSFKAYSFRYNEDGLPELVDAEEAREKVNAEGSILGDIDQGFDYSFSNLLQRAELMGIKDNTAKSAITRLLQKGKLTKSDGKYRLAEG